MQLKLGVVAALSLALVIGLLSGHQTATAAPGVLQLPWPAGHQHRQA